MSQIEEFSHQRNVWRIDIRSIPSPLRRIPSIDRQLARIKVICFPKKNVLFAFSINFFFLGLDYLDVRLLPLQLILKSLLRYNPNLERLVLFENRAKYSSSRNWPQVPNLIFKFVTEMKRLVAVRLFRPCSIVLTCKK